MRRNDDGTLACICYEHKPQCDCIGCDMANLGMGHHYTRERFPDGCDWHKPPGCHCKLLLQRAACYENCDDVQRIQERKRNRSMRRILALLFVLFMISCAISLLTTRANSADLLPKKPPVYCAVLKKFERNCEGVKAATRWFGRARAEMLATRCGATPEEIIEALACLRI